MDRHKTRGGAAAGTSQGPRRDAHPGRFLAVFAAGDATSPHKQERLPDHATAYAAASIAVPWPRRHPLAGFSAGAALACPQDDATRLAA